MKYMAKIFLLLLLGVGCVVSHIYAMEKGVFKPPSLDGYTYEKSWKVDADEIKDGVKETTIAKYVNPAGQVILKATANGKIWCWSILNKYSDKTDNINNYAIRDVEGKGVFTEKYAGNEQFYLPGYAK